MNGLNMYYEGDGVEKTGTPLVLLHGALSNIETDFGALLPRFAEGRKVIAIEQQAHGRTADIDRPFSYKQMADDTANLLTQLNVQQADFFCYSMGGAISLEIAWRHPDLVRKLVFAGGAAFRRDGIHPEAVAMFDTITVEQQVAALAGSPFHEAYLRLAPNPADWPTLVAKNTEADKQWQGWSAEELQAITVPVLVINGDADIIRPEHTVEMFRLLGGGGVPGDLVGRPRSWLGVLPGTTHITVMHRTDWLASMIGEFLDTTMPETE